MNKFKQNVGNIFFNVFLISLLLLIISPYRDGMSSMFEMSLLAIIMLLLVFFMVFIWKEEARDERDEVHKNLAGKIAFLSGIVFLSIGFIFQTITHNLDVWIPSALCVMVVSKVFTRVILSKYK